MKKLIGTATAILLAVILTGCGSFSVKLPEISNGSLKEIVDAATPSQEPVIPSAENVQDGSATETISKVEALVVAEPANVDSYDREAFKHWTTNNDSGCNTRIAVLIREGQNVEMSGTCTVTGTWHSVYDGATTTNPSTFDIDHMVPLKEAWVSGAYAWDDATREAYANDLDYQYSLLAVSASSNRSKSDSDPASWTPDTMNLCEYVTRWVEVKTRWGLTIDSAEKSYLTGTLTGC